MCGRVCVLPLSDSTRKSYSVRNCKCAYNCDSCRYELSVLRDPLYSSRRCRVSHYVTTADMVLIYRENEEASALLAGFVNTILSLGRFGNASI